MHPDHLFSALRKDKKMSGKSNKRFVLESSLGKLTRWLRVLGFDSVYVPGVPDKSFFVFEKEGRILLTRTRKIQNKMLYRDLLFIRFNDPWDQLKQVVSELDICLCDINPFSRCIRCNSSLQEISREQVLSLVPDYVYETQYKFSQCPLCRKIYWPGTHFERSMRIINGFFPQPCDHFLFRI